MNILLSGAPGVGKTTVMVRLAERLGGRRVAGFYTAEMRRGGRRHGFGVRTFSGGRGVLADVDFAGPQRVGRYGVEVGSFEALVLPEMSRECDILLIDEIGKMECFSARFVEAVERALDSPVPVVATVAQKGAGFVAGVKRRADTELWMVSRDNRDELPARLAARLGAPG